MRKLIVAAVAVGAIAALSLAPQPAQARCSIVTVTAKGATQGIATFKAERRVQRYVRQNVTGARVGHASTTCQGWLAGRGVEGVRPVCQRAAVVCR
jgi:hypothetical protein